MVNYFRYILKQKGWKYSIGKYVCKPMYVRTRHHLLTRIAVILILIRDCFRPRNSTRKYVSPLPVLPYITGMKLGHFSTR